MVAVMWDPGQYLRFDDERGRPFRDLLARVDAKAPGCVVDLGCGPGNLTAILAQRWPEAQVLGLDNSPEMIAAASAAASAAAGSALPDSALPDSALPDSALPDSAGAGSARGGRLSFALADIREWRPDHPVDVFVSNAVLQWVPDHLGLLTRWAGLLAPGGWLAAALPGNFDQPSHAILRNLATSSRWRALLGGVSLNRQAGDPAVYLDLLARAGCHVDAWETTYLHVLHGEDPVLEWYKGSGLRPVLAALPPGRSADFLAEYAAGVRDAYPPAPYGTVLPFRRVFVVASRR
jgi:trans-aconitate 2-methyltransferase